MGTNKIYDAIFSEDDIKWQSIIYELIRSKKVDPWDIDLSKFIVKEGDIQTIKFYILA